MALVRHPIPKASSSGPRASPHLTRGLGGLASQFERSAMTATLSVHLIQGPEEFEALSPESERLALEMRPRVPFATSDWLKLWWRHYRQNRLLVRDQFFMH